jgi:hydroxymethylbilane synthase
MAERAFLRSLGGGCQIPIGALGQVEGDYLHLWGMISDPEGKRLIREDVSGPGVEAERLGEELAARIWPQAQEILQGERIEGIREEDGGKG